MEQALGYMRCLTKVIISGVHVTREPDLPTKSINYSLRASSSYYKHKFSYFTFRIPSLGISHEIFMCFVRRVSGDLILANQPTGSLHSVNLM